MEPNGSTAQTFSAYLAAQYMAKKAFTSGTVPEAQALLSAADIVLTASDGVRFEIVCIVDREVHPDKRFAMAREAVQEIGKACLKYSGKVSGSKMPVVVHVIEVGPGPIEAADRARLKAFKASGAFSKVALTGWLVSTGSASVWSSQPFNGLFAGRGFIEGLLRRPRESEAELKRPAVALPAQARFPLVTCILLAVLAAAFGAEIRLGVEPWTGLLAPSVRTLVALGGLFPGLVRSGEWYRVLTAAFLHADIVHLVFNGIALYLAGAALEGLIGRAWFLALFLIGALGGSLMSLAINPPTLVSVGASGAIMGLLAAAYVCSFRYPPGGGRTRIQMSMLQVLIPSLIPIAASGSGQHIDYAAHLGGALSGLAAGCLLLKTWREESPVPRFSEVAAAICVAGALAVPLSVVPLRSNYESYALENFLIPRDQIPKTDGEAASRSADLVARYPRDPRARLLRASALLNDRDLTGAESQLRAALGEEQMLRSKFSPELEARLRAMLALVLLEKGQAAEAREAARPVCKIPGAPRDTLTKFYLCP